MPHKYMVVITDADFGILEKHCLYYAAILGASLWATWITWMPFLHVRRPLCTVPCCDHLCLAVQVFITSLSIALVATGNIFAVSST